MGRGPSRPKKWLVVQLDAEGNEMGYVRTLYAPTNPTFIKEFIKEYNLLNFIKYHNPEADTENKILKAVEMDENKFKEDKVQGIQEFFITIVGLQDETGESDLFFLAQKMDEEAVRRASKPKTKRKKVV